MITCMDYSEARDAFFAPRSGTVRPLPWSTPARRLRDAIEPLATISFWSQATNDAYAGFGLDFLGGYVYGRASDLGEAEPAVVAAAFGVFEPGLIADLYAGARDACSLDQVRDARLSGTTQALHDVLGEPAAVDGLTETLDALRAALAAGPTVGRALFAGLSGRPWPDDPWAQLWHACTMLREHRGDGHLATVVAADLDGLEANILTERWVGWEPLAYTGSRAWSPESMAAATARLEARGLITGDSLTAAGQELRDGIETATDASVDRVVSVLAPELDTLLPRLEAWSAAVVDAGWFPPDPYKRAAG